MVNIAENGIISIDRGDYLKYPIFINAGDYMNPLRYVLQDNDKLYFSVMEPNLPFELGVIRKVLTQSDCNANNDPVLILNASDTQNLIPGNYYYEIKLSIRRNNLDLISTIVPSKKFIIL